MSTKNINTSNIVFSSWVYNRKDEYDIQLIFPDYENSNIGKRVVQDMMEERFQIENIPQEKSEEEIDAMFNLAVSERVFALSRNKLSEILTNIDRAEKILNHPDLKDVPSHLIEDAKSILPSLRSDYLDLKKDVERMSAPLNSPDYKKRFLSGEVWYKNTSSKKPLTPQEIINRKKQTPLTEDENMLTISELYARIENTLEKAELLLGKCSRLLEGYKESASIKEEEALSVVGGEEVEIDEIDGTILEETYIPEEGFGDKEKGIPLENTKDNNSEDTQKSIKKKKRPTTKRTNQ